MTKNAEGYETDAENTVYNPHRLKVEGNLLTLASDLRRDMAARFDALRKESRDDKLADKIDAAAKAAEECCCELKKVIEASAKETASLIRDEGAKTRELINRNERDSDKAEIADLRARLREKDYPAPAAPPADKR